MASGNVSVAKGERVPLAVKILPASSDYRNFTIDPENTRVSVMNSLGVEITTYGDTSIDEDNKTVLFSWDTSKYDIGAYTLVFWISVSYNGTDFLMKSNTISKSIKQSSTIG